MRLIGRHLIDVSIEVLNALLASDSSKVKRDWGKRNPKVTYHCSKHDRHWASTSG